MPQPIVLIHGLWMTPKSWEGWAERFRAKGHEVITPGWSDAFDRSPEDLRRDPSALAGLTAAQVADRYEQAIRALPEPPIIMGHSFGGLFTQVMLNRGLGAAGVGVDAAAAQGRPQAARSRRSSRAGGSSSNPAQPWPGRAVHAEAVQVHVRELALRGGVAEGVGDVRRAGSRTRVHGGRERELQSELGVQDRVRQGRSRSAPSPRRRPGSRRPGFGHARERSRSTRRGSSRSRSTPTARTGRLPRTAGRRSPTMRSTGRRGTPRASPNRLQ